MTVGSKPHTRTTKVEFLVVNCSSAYNAILGRPLLNQLGAMVFTAHLMMKFPAENRGIIFVKGDQTTTRHCYNASMEIRPKKSTTSGHRNEGQVLSIDLDVRKTKLDERLGPEG